MSSCADEKKPAIHANLLRALVKQTSVRLKDVYKQSNIGDGEFRYDHLELTSAVLAPLPPPHRLSVNASSPISDP